MSCEEREMLLIQHAVYLIFSFPELFLCKAQMLTINYFSNHNSSSNFTLCKHIIMTTTLCIWEIPVAATHTNERTALGLQ